MFGHDPQRVKTRLYSYGIENRILSTRFLFRPILVLKSEQGFVGYKAGSAKLECNKATYETIHVERGDRGKVFFKGQ